MKLMDAVRYGFSNYANFKGRTDRPTFWWWVLAAFGINIVLDILNTATDEKLEGRSKLTS